jgi:DNA-binding winged helix-turn-helix (wHTH) protein
VGTRHYYSLPLTINEKALDHITVRALFRIVKKHGEFVSFNELVDQMFGVESSVRSSVVQTRIAGIKYDLDELAELNPDLIEAGDLDPVKTYGYRLTEKAVQIIDEEGELSEHSSR